MLMLFTMGFSLAAVRGQRVCETPVEFGEVRVMADRSTRCVGTRPGTGGTGALYQLPCTNKDEQVLIYCKDRSIRIKESNYCVEIQWDERTVRSDTSFLRAVPCKLYGGGLPMTQQWDLEDANVEHRELLGVPQRTRRIRWHGGGSHNGNHFYWALSSVDRSIFAGTVFSGLAMRVPSEWRMFYFRNRGAMIGHGQIEARYGGCLADVGDGSVNGRANNVVVVACNPGGVAPRGSHYGPGFRPIFDKLSRDHSMWRMHSNGEIVNVASGRCLDALHEDWALTRNCRLEPGQVFDFRVQRDGAAFSLRPQQVANRCLQPRPHDMAGHWFLGLEIPDFDGFEVETVLLYKKPCDLQNDQYFKFRREWTPPVATWARGDCAVGSPLGMTIVSGVEYSKEVSEETSIEVSAELEFETFFGGATVSTSVARTMGQAFGSATSSGTEVEVSCDFYNNGDAYDTRNGGCFWRFEVTTSKDGRPLTWRPSITRCTRGLKPPTCNGFERCGDRACSCCLPMHSTKTSCA